MKRIITQILLDIGSLYEEPLHVDEIFFTAFVIYDEQLVPECKYSFRSYKISKHSVNRVKRLKKQGMLPRHNEI